MSGRGDGAGHLVRALRPLHWTKNALVFVPAAMAHEITDPSVLIDGAVAFLSFCLCASGAYLINDLADIEFDRRHPRKRHRPIASGAVSGSVASVLAAVLLAGGIVLGAALPNGFWIVVSGYVAATLAYSAFLKRLVLVDVLVLAGLYTLRLFGGGIGTRIPLSPWLLAFSMFFFLGLAVLKRYSELRTSAAPDGGGLRGRAYLRADMDVLRSVGTASGYLSVLVLALYINSEAVSALYTNALGLWLIGPVLIYWITRLWLLAHRGEMHEDPIVFAAKDPASYAVGAAIALLLLVAA
ncbi:MAG: UbiA family prenyltransferase [Gemmatimonadota bacterium]